MEGCYSLRMNGEECNLSNNSFCIESRCRHSLKDGNEKRALGHYCNEKRGLVDVLCFTNRGRFGKIN